MSDKSNLPAEQLSRANRVREGFVGVLVATSVMAMVVSVYEGALTVMPFAAAGLIVGLVLAVRVNRAKGIHWSGRRK